MIQNAARLPVKTTFIQSINSGRSDGPGGWDWETWRAAGAAGINASSSLWLILTNSIKWHPIQWEAKRSTRTVIGSICFRSSLSLYLQHAPSSLLTPSAPSCLPIIYPFVRFRPFEVNRYSSDKDHHRGAGRGEWLTKRNIDHPN